MAAASNPKGQRTVSTATNLPRCLAEMYSETSAVSTGIMPPRHIPVMNR